MQTYESTRLAMISLGALAEGSGTSFPPLREADTFMKSFRKTRQVGDSRFTDSLLWRVAAGSSTTQPDSLPTTHFGGTTSAMSGTQMDTRRSGDRVQWFRAEADMQRWQEQKEQNLVELLQTIQSFVKMQSDMWLVLIRRRECMSGGWKMHETWSGWTGTRHYFRQGQM
ncbi:hypothetical protein DFH09DRAFT_1085810 [Mycena vulgaris]|nr:hypothetical protein DFH09DRAFT_1085810 [Mycena vulgaris]